MLTLPRNPQKLSCPLNPPLTPTARSSSRFLTFSIFPTNARFYEEPQPILPPRHRQPHKTTLSPEKSTRGQTRLLPRGAWGYRYKIYLSPLYPPYYIYIIGGTRNNFILALPCLSLQSYSAMRQAQILAEFRFTTRYNQNLSRFMRFPKLPQVF